MSSSKILRQSKIKEIITVQEIGSQEELTQILRDNEFDRLLKEYYNIEILLKQQKLMVLKKLFTQVLSEIR